MSHAETKERLSRAFAALGSDEGFHRWYQPDLRAGASHI